MTIEYYGEKQFYQEIKAGGVVWVARSIYKNIYALELDKSGLSLPVWSTRERVISFLNTARLVGPKYEPDSVPLDVFANAWLSDQAMGISELQINPDGKSSRVLVFTVDEFQLPE